MEFFNHLMRRPHTRVAVTVSWFLALFLLFFNLAINVLAPGEPTVVSTQNLQDFSTGQVAGLVDLSGTNAASTLNSEVADITPTQAPSEKDEKESKKTTASTDESKEGGYTVAFYGDSIIDTLGESFPYLDEGLQKKYPNATFSLYNYGMGAQNVEEGLRRFDESFTYRGRSYPALYKLEPDVIILGSFSYNPFDPHDRDKHWLTFAKLIEQARKTGAQVYVLAEIAPRRYEFGNGPQGVNWEPAVAYEHSGRVIQQIENALGLSKNFNVRLIDAYSDSLASKNRNEGKAEYASTIDGIHPSKQGREFMMDKIVEDIKL